MGLIRYEMMNANTSTVNTERLIQKISAATTNNTTTTVRLVA
ncbi:MAG: hypothetical protein R2856_32845 [Caldilineaceae bacterium]